MFFSFQETAGSSNIQTRHFFISRFRIPVHHGRVHSSNGVATVIGEDGKREPSNSNGQFGNADAGRTAGGSAANDGLDGGLTGSGGRGRGDGPSDAEGGRFGGVDGKSGRGGHGGTGRSDGENQGGSEGGRFAVGRHGEGKGGSDRRNGNLDEAGRGLKGSVAGSSNAGGIAGSGSLSGSMGGGALDGDGSIGGSDGGSSEGGGSAEGVLVGSFGTGAKNGNPAEGGNFAGGRSTASSERLFGGRNFGEIGKRPFEGGNFGSNQFGAGSIGGSLPVGHFDGSNIDGGSSSMGRGQGINGKNQNVGGYFGTDKFGGVRSEQNEGYVGGFATQEGKNWPGRIDFNGGRYAPGGAPGEVRGSINGKGANGVWTYITQNVGYGQPIDRGSQENVPGWPSPRSWESGTYGSRGDANYPAQYGGAAVPPGAAGSSIYTQNRPSGYGHNDGTTFQGINDQSSFGAARFDKPHANGATGNVNGPVASYQTTRLSPLRAIRVRCRYTINREDIYRVRNAPDKKGSVDEYEVTDERISGFSYFQSDGTVGPCFRLVSDNSGNGQSLQGADQYHMRGFHTPNRSPGDYLGETQQHGSDGSSQNQFGVGTPTQSNGHRLQGSNTNRFSSNGPQPSYQGVGDSHSANSAQGTSTYQSLGSTVTDNLAQSTHIQPQSGTFNVTRVSTSNSGGTAPSMGSNYQSRGAASLPQGSLNTEDFDANRPHRGIALTKGKSGRPSTFQGGAFASGNQGESSPIGIASSQLDFKSGLSGASHVTLDANRPRGSVYQNQYTGQGRGVIPTGQVNIRGNEENSGLVRKPLSNGNDSPNRRPYIDGRPAQNPIVGQNIHYSRNTFGTSLTNYNHDFGQRQKGGEDGYQSSIGGDGRPPHGRERPQDVTSPSSNGNANLPDAKNGQNAGNHHRPQRSNTGIAIVPDANFGDLAGSTQEVHSGLHSPSGDQPGAPSVGGAGNIPTIGIPVISHAVFDSKLGTGQVEKGVSHIPSGIAVTPDSILIFAGSKLPNTGSNTVLFPSDTLSLSKGTIQNTHIPSTLSGAHSLKTPHLSSGNDGSMPSGLSGGSRTGSQSIEDGSLVGGGSPSDWKGKPPKGGSPPERGSGELLPGSSSGSYLPGGILGELLTDRGFLPEISGSFPRTVSSSSTLIDSATGSNSGATKLPVILSSFPGGDAALPGSLSDYSRSGLSFPGDSGESSGGIAGGLPGDGMYGGSLSGSLPSLPGGGSVPGLLIPGSIDESNGASGSGFPGGGTPGFLPSSGSLLSSSRADGPRRDSSGLLDSLSSPGGVDNRGLPGEITGTPDGSSSTDGSYAGKYPTGLTVPLPEEALAGLPTSQAVCSQTLIQILGL